MSTVLEESPRRRFDWRLPLYAVVGTFVLILPALFYEPDISLIVYTVLAVPISLLLVIVSIWKKPLRVSIFTMLIAYWIISATFLTNYKAVRTTVRWLALSHRYKAEVLAQPASQRGEFQHVQWDGWGWAGMDTTEFVVFDPTDSLLVAAKTHQSGKFNGVPCAVNVVRHLERGWYSVQLYTGEDWERCE